MFYWYIAHPWRIALIGLAFLAAFALIRLRHPGSRALGTWSLLIPAILWFMAAIWESFVPRDNLDANIRIDLFLILPLLFVASVVGIALAIFRRT